jgi:hypothetical protein
VDLIYLVGILIFFLFFYDKALGKLGLSSRDGWVMFMGIAFFRILRGVGDLCSGYESSALIDILLHGVIFYYCYYRAQSSLTN